MSDNASPPGSSTYDSSTMYVGDGTWIASKNTFLLPNLQGLNFATMQYNSMSSRFSSLPEYHKLILGHGVMAAIVFLLVVPSAIFTAKFYFRNPRLALRLHIWLQILTVGLLTVVFILGWFAVGPERSLTNPHHGIGVAIYTLVLVQALGGGLIHHVEKGKARWRLPLKLMLHQWLGRGIALLGVVQIALGLTLYGSPKYLFILYALVCFAWLSLYFILTYINRPVIGGNDGYSSESYVSGPTRTDISNDRRSRRNESHGVRNAGLFGAGLAGLAALRQRSKSRRPEDNISRTNRTDASPSRLTSRHSAAYTDDDEKYATQGQTKDRHTWRDRFLGAGVGLGAYEGVKRFFNRGRKRDEESDIASYRPPNSDSQFSRADVARVQEGQAPMSPGDSRLSRPSHAGQAAFVSPTRQALRPRTSMDSLTSDGSRDSFESDHRPLPIEEGGHGLRNGIATLGVLGFLRAKRDQRRDRKDQRRVDSMRQEDQINAERINRANSRRYANRPSDIGRRRPSAADTLETEDFTELGSNPELSRNRRANIGTTPLPASAATMPADVVNPNYASPQNIGYDPASGVQNVPNTTLQPPMTTTGYPLAPGALSMPQAAVEPDPSRLTDPFHGSRTNLPPNIALGAAAVANRPSSPSRHGRSQSQQNRRNSTSNDSAPTVASPPVSVKVQMHKDGRHVTLRRLNEEEAAAERDARKQERRQRRRRAESLSSGVEDEGVRFRRNDGTRPPNSIPNPYAGRPPSELNLPPPPGPPPVPAHSISPQGPGLHPSHVNSGLTSGVGSPGTYETGTGTDLSAFDSNRRRRRAERAAARERAAQQGARVEFS